MGKPCGDEKTGLLMTAVFLVLRGLRWSKDYNLFTAAVAKIALSVGPVNHKPQHIVFGW
jgi:hypothetical protein